MKWFLAGLMMSATTALALPSGAWAQGGTITGKVIVDVEEEDQPVEGVTIEILINDGKTPVDTTARDGTAEVDYTSVPIPDEARVQVVYRNCDDEIVIVFLAPGEELDDDCDDTLLGFIIWGRTDRIYVSVGPTGPTMTSTLAEAQPWWKPRFAFGGGLTVDTLSEAEEAACEDPGEGINLQSCELDATGAGFSLFAELGPVTWVRGGLIYQKLHKAELIQTVTFDDSPVGTVGEQEGFFDAWMVGPYIIGVAPFRYVQPWFKILFLYLSEESGSDVVIRDVNGNVLDEDSNRQETKGWNVLPAIGADVHIAPWLTFRGGFEWGTLDTDADEGEEPVDEEIRKGIFSIVIHP